MHEPATRAAERVARESYGRLLAWLAARDRDVAAAEDALADAFQAALARWPVDGVPANPEAWLLTTARRRRIDARRHSAIVDAAIPELLHRLPQPATEAPLPEARLGLLFACAHPAIDAGMRAPLMLQMVLGLDAAAIAAAFLVAPSAMSQRLVRGKRKIRDAGIPFALPVPSELPARLATMLEAIYAAFGTAYGTEGADEPCTARALSDEALWLARITWHLLPEQAEAGGLLALLLFVESRRATRRDGDGAYVPLERQDPQAWDQELIDEAERVLQAALALNRRSGQPIGRLQLEAAIQSAHAARRRTGRTDQGAVLALYDALLAVTGSIVVAVNRAAALAARDGARAGLEALDLLADDPRLAGYQPYWATRAALLAAAGERAEAAAAFTRAIALTADPAVRKYLKREADKVTDA